MSKNDSVNVSEITECDTSDKFVYSAEKLYQLIIQGYSPEQEALEKASLDALFLQFKQKWEFIPSAEQNVVQQGKRGVTHSTFYCTTDSSSTLPFVGPTKTIVLPIHKNLFNKEGFKLNRITIKLRPILKGGWYISIVRNFECRWVFVKPIVWHHNFPFSIPFASLVHKDFTPAWKIGYISSAATLEGAAMSTFDKIQEAADGVKIASNQIQDTFNLDNLEKVFTNMADNLTNDIKATIELLLFINTAAFGVRYYHTRDPSDFKWATVSASFIAMMKGPQMLVSLANYFNYGEGITLEDDYGPDGLSEGLFHMCKSYFEIDFKAWNKIYSNISNFDRFKSGLGSIISFVGNIVNEICNFIFSSRPVPLSILGGGMAPENVLEFCKEIDEVQKAIDVGKLPINNVTFVKLEDLKNQCDKMISVQKSNAITSILTQRSKIIRALCDKLRHQQVGIADERVEPVAVLLQGCPGTTKSKWMNLLATMLCDTTETPFPRNYHADYWDGYVGQKVVTLDDFGQVRDVAGQDRSEYGEFIQMINTAPFLLNMSSVEDKGREYFKADYVLATTNLRKFELQSITDSGAVIRRFKHLVFRIVPADPSKNTSPLDSFCAKPDWSCFDMEDGIAKIDPTDFLFVQYDLNSKQEKGRFTVHEVIDMIKRQRRHNVRLHEHRLDLLEKVYSAQVSNSTDLVSEEDVDSLDAILMDVEKSEDDDFHFATVNYDPTVFEKLSKRFKNTFRRVMEEYSEYHRVTVDVAKAFGTLIKRWTSYQIRRLLVVTDYSSRYKLFQENFVYAHSVSQEKFSSCYETTKKAILATDPIIGRATLWKISLGTVLTIVHLGAAYYMKKPGEFESNGPPVQKTTQIQSLAQMRAANLSPANLQGGDVLDSNGKTMYSAMFDRNLYFIGGDNSSASLALAICDRYLLMNAHMLYRIQARVKETGNSNILIEFKLVSSPEHKKGYHISFSNLLKGMIDSSELEAKDLVLVKFPEDMRIHKDIREHFVEEKNLKDVYDYVRRFSYSYTMPKGCYTVAREFSVGKVVRNNNVHCIHPSKGSVYLDAYLMVMFHGNGLCGSPYVNMNSKLQKGKILGIHGAGTGEYSVCVIVTRDILDNALNNREVIFDALEQNAAELQANEPHCGHFYYLSEARKFNVTSKSDFVKSALYNLVIEPLTFPARLTPFSKDGVFIDPAVVSLTRYNNKQDIYVEDTILDSCIASEIDWYRKTNTFSTERRVFSLKEAVLGLDDDECFKSITRKTSPGYPYVCDRKGKGRFEFFGDQPIFDLSRPKFKLLEVEIYADIKRILEDNKLPDFYNIDCLKDECVSKKKFDSGMTRTFSAGDLKSLLMYRMYFGDFAASMMKNRFTNGSSVGINPYSADWDYLARKLCRFGGERMNAGDYSAFDASQTAQLLMALLRIIEDHYRYASESERKIRRYLWYRAINSVHVSKGNIYKWDGGLPSGWFLTALVNTMYNRCAFKLAFYQVVPFDTKAFWIFNDKVELICYGDDNVFSCSKELDEVFNEYTIVEPLSNLGLKYTPEDKTIESYKDVKRSIYDVSFLKRKWRYCKEAGRFVAPMLLGPLLNQLNWTRKTNGNTILLDKANKLTMELSMHGVDIFSQYVTIINTHLSERLGVSLDCTDYLQCLTNCLNLEGEILEESSMNFNTNENLSDTDHARFSRARDSLKVTVEKLAPATLEADLVAGDSADFVDQNDAEIMVVDEAKPLSTGRFGKDSGNSGVVDIARFLSKPVIIKQGVFSITDGPITFSEDEWYQPLISSTYADKFKNVYSINAKLVLRLQVNASPTQQGLYMLCYLPMGGASDTTKRDLWRRMHRFSVLQCYQLPHALLNLSTQTEAVLEIPWSSAYNSYLPSTTNPTRTCPGIFFIYPVVTLSTGSGGSVDASFTLWANYTDIKLGMVGSLQADAPSVKKTMAVKTKQDPIAEEQETKKISRVLYATSEISGTLAKIPLLSAFAQPLSYALTGAGIIADALGFSKPSLIDPPMRVVNPNYPYMATSDGVDASEPLSLTIRNHVSTDPSLVGTALDEMSIAFITSRPSYLDYIAWNSTAASGVLLKQWFVTPSTMQNIYNDGTNDYVDYTPINWVSNYFNLWRGSITYHFEIVKTNFHSGRLLIAFQPFDRLIQDSISTTLSNSVPMYRNIVDIREKSKFDITVPYVSASPWHYTGGSNTAIGTLSMIVLDELKHPDMVSNFIIVIVHATGGKDLAFASPRQFDYRPTSMATFQSGEVALINQFSETTIGDAVVPELSSVAEEASIGEISPSLRLLLKRGGFIYKQPVSAGLQDEHLICPFHNYNYYVLGAVVTGDPTKITHDPFSHFSAVYALSRGGVRVRCIESGGVATDTNYVIGLDTVNPSAGALSSVVTTNATNVDDYMDKMTIVGNIVYGSSSQIGGVFVPQYSRTLSRPNATHIIYGNSDLTYDFGEDSPAQVRYTAIGNDTSTSTIFHRSGADDCTFGGFVSIPPSYRP